jgi:hypothetical protein
LGKDKQNATGGKDKQNATEMMTATHAVMRVLARRVTGVGHKLFVDSFFSSAGLFDDLHTRQINCCGTFRQHSKGIPGDFDS